MEEARLKEEEASRLQDELEEVRRTMKMEQEAIGSTESHLLEQTLEEDEEETFRLQVEVIVGQICTRNKNWSRCSHPAESMEFCIQRYFDKLTSKIAGSKRSDQWMGRRLEFQYGRHDETLIITGF